MITNYHAHLESKVLRNAVIIALINSLLVIFLDKEFIAPNMYDTYVTIQLVSVAFFAVLLLYRKIAGFTSNLTAVFLGGYLLYSCLCQFFIPCSFMSFIICLFIVAVFSKLPRSTLLKIAIPYTVAMIYCIFTSDVSYATSAELTEKFKLDSSQTMVITVTLILLAHTYRLKEISKYELLSNNVMSLGSQSLMFIHDLKGQIFPPLNHVNYLMKNGTENKQVIEELQNNLNDMKNYIVQANQSFSLSNENTNIELAAIIEDLKNLYRSKISDINIEVSQEGNLVSNPTMIKSALLNMILNSEEEFRKKSIKNKKINVSFKNRTLLFKDNAGGFSKDSLKKINSNEFFTNKENGSGVGLYTIKNYSTAMNSKLSFLNEGASAVIKIVFPKDAING